MIYTPLTPLLYSETGVYKFIYISYFCSRSLTSTDANVRIPSNKRESVRNCAQDLVLNIKEKRTGFKVSFKIRMCEKKCEVVTFFLVFMKMNDKTI